MREGKLSGDYLERVPYVWASRSAILWLILNLIDLAESLVARSIGCGELNPFIPLDSLVRALCYKVLLTIGALVFLDRIEKLHLIRWLNIAMVVVVVWNALVILMSGTV